jgi:hypothetical protein
VTKKLAKIRHARLTQKAVRKAVHAKKTARLKKAATRPPRPPNIDSGRTSAEAAKFLHVTLGTLWYHDRRGSLKPRYVHRDGRLVKTYTSVELARLSQRLSRRKATAKAAKAKKAKSTKEMAS